MWCHCPICPHGRGSQSVVAASWWPNQSSACSSYAYRRTNSAALESVQAFTIHGLGVNRLVNSAGHSNTHRSWSICSSAISSQSAIEPWASSADSGTVWRNRRRRGQPWQSSRSVLSDHPRRRRPAAECCSRRKMNHGQSATSPIARAARWGRAENTLYLVLSDSLCNYVILCRGKAINASYRTSRCGKATGYEHCTVQLVLLTLCVASDATAATPSVLNMREPIIVPRPMSDSVINVLITFVKNSGVVVAVAINVAAAKSCLGTCVRRSCVCVGGLERFGRCACRIHKETEDGLRDCVRCSILYTINKYNILRSAWCLQMASFTRLF